MEIGASGPTPVYVSTAAARCDELRLKGTSWRVPPMGVRCWRWYVMLWPMGNYDGKCASM